MAARNQSAVGVHWDSSAGTYFSVHHKFICITGFAQAKRLVILELLVRGRVMQLQEVEILRSASGFLVCLLRSELCQQIHGPWTVAPHLALHHRGLDAH